ncbi:MAG: zinc-ribbon domain-containing protein [Thermodesulfovibrionales bacterium]
MIVICPKCKIKLKVDDGKLTEAGSRFKCPKCSTVLLVKKPAPVQEKPTDNMKILVAHSNPAIINEIIPLLNQNSYETITASDGIEAMVKAIKELPFLAVIEVSLPKIYGFEVCKRLKARPETKWMKFILISSPYDKNRYRREPESLYDADDYIEEHRITGLLMDSINAFRSKKPDDKKEEKVEKPAEAPVKEKTEQKTEPETKPVEKISAPTSDDKIERARRLARTIISDIYLYNTAKADESIRNNTFSSVFVPEIKEGLKLYENRIAQEVRDKGDFFKEVLRNFLENKKKSL